MMLAAREGHFHATFLLLKEGANLNEPSGSNDDTPLTLACWKGHDKVVQLLLENRSNIDHQTKTGCTPLMEATREGYCKVASQLLEHGAEVETPDNYGQSPLFMACWKGHSDVAELLLRYGANKDCRTKTGITPLFQACRENHVEVVKLLLDYGCSVNALFPNSRECPLTLAAEKGFDDLVLLLLRCDVFVDCRTKKGCTPFFLSCKEGYLELSRALYDHSACPESSDLRNTTPLVAAFRNGHIKIVEWLLKFVNHLPSDDDCRKTLIPTAGCNDKELLISKTKCHELIRKAKFAKERAAMHVAKILCDEVDAEKEKRENRKKAQARKKMKRKEKKKVKKDSNSENKNDSLAPQNQIISPSIEDCDNVSLTNASETNSITTTSSSIYLDICTQLPLDCEETNTPMPLSNAHSSPTACEDSPLTDDDHLISEQQSIVYNHDEDKLMNNNEQKNIDINQISNCHSKTKYGNSGNIANNNKNNSTNENVFSKSNIKSTQISVNQETKPSSPIGYSPIHSPLNSLSRVTSESTPSDTEVTSLNTEDKQNCHSASRSPESRITNHKNSSKLILSNSNSNNNCVCVHNTAKTQTNRHSTTTSPQNSKYSTNFEKNNDHSHRRRSCTNLKTSCTNNNSSNPKSNNKNSISNHAPLKRKASSPSTTLQNSTDTVSKRSFSNSSFTNQTSASQILASNHKSTQNIPSTSHLDCPPSNRISGSWANAATPTTSKVTPISPATYSQVTSNTAPHAALDRTISPVYLPAKPPTQPKDKPANPQQEFFHNDSKCKQPSLTSLDTIIKQKTIDCTTENKVNSDDDMEISNYVFNFNNNSNNINNAKGNKTLSIPVPRLQVGRVIGKGGSRINDITDLSGAHIHVSKPSTKNQERIITIKGNDKSISIAQHLITQALSTPDKDIDFYQIALKEGIISWEKLSKTINSQNTQQQTSNMISEHCLSKNSSPIKSQTIDYTNILVDRPNSNLHNSPEQTDIAASSIPDSSTNLTVSSPVKHRFGAIGQEVGQPHLSTFITCTDYNHASTDLSSDVQIEHTFGAIGQPSRYQLCNCPSSHKEVNNQHANQYSAYSNGFVHSIKPFLDTNPSDSSDLPVSPNNLTQSVWNFDPSSLNKHSTLSWWPSLNMSSSNNDEGARCQDISNCWNDRDIKLPPLTHNYYEDMNGDGLQHNISVDNDNESIWRNISPTDRSHSQTSNYCSYQNDYLSDSTRDLCSCEEIDYHINGGMKTSELFSTLNGRWPRVEDLIMKNEDYWNCKTNSLGRRCKLRTMSQDVINGQVPTACKDISDQISISHLSGYESQNNYSLT